MSIVSHLHHLFNAETCHAYIHALRWKDRPLQCPRCQSHHVGPWGTYHYQPGLQRYRLTGCKFSRGHTLLSLALVEVQNKGRVGCRQKNVWKAGVAITTKCA